jgi:hypothetical protein
MSPELLLLIVGALGLGGVRALWGRRGQDAHVIHVRTEWVRAGQIVRYGPVGAMCCGNRPHKSHGKGVFGALGLTDGKLVFVGHRSTRYNVSIPFDLMHWIGLHTLNGGAGARAIIVHYQSPSGWYVYTFTTDAPVEFGQALSRHSGLPLHDADAIREDFGPARATRMIQDIYGQWQPEYEIELYLAPGRLLFGWKSPILLERITRLDVLTKGGLEDLNPFSEDLLRIEYETPDGARETIGFVVRNAHKWAEAISRHTDAPLVIHAGRKKKSS